MHKKFTRKTIISSSFRISFLMDKTWQEETENDVEELHIDYFITYRHKYTQDEYLVLNLPCINHTNDLCF